MVQFVNLHLNFPERGQGLSHRPLQPTCRVSDSAGGSAEDLQEFPFLVHSQMLLVVRATLRTTAVESQ